MFNLAQSVFGLLQDVVGNLLILFSVTEKTPLSQSSYVKIKAVENKKT